MDPVPHSQFEYRGLLITVEITGLGEQLSVGASVHGADGKLIGRAALTAAEADRDALFNKVNDKARAMVDALLDVKSAGQQAARTGAS